MRLERAHRLPDHGAERPLTRLGAHRMPGGGRRRERVAGRDRAVRGVDLAVHLPEQPRPSASAVAAAAEHDARLHAVGAGDDQRPRRS